MAVVWLYIVYTIKRAPWQTKILGDGECAAFPPRTLGLARVPLSWAYQP